MRLWGLDYHLCSSDECSLGTVNAVIYLSAILTSQDSNPGGSAAAANCSPPSNCTQAKRAQYPRSGCGRPGNLPSSSFCWWRQLYVWQHECTEYSLKAVVKVTAKHLWNARTRFKVMKNCLRKAYNARTVQAVPFLVWTHFVLFFYIVINHKSRFILCLQFSEKSPLFTVLDLDDMLTVIDGHKLCRITFLFANLLQFFSTCIAILRSLLWNLQKYIPVVSLKWLCMQHNNQMNY